MTAKKKSTPRKPPTISKEAPGEQKLLGERIPLKPEDIGGELISLMSEGLYKNPLDAFREYIQNSIDAGTKRVILKFTGRSVFITDYGRGMNKEKLVRARRFGVSDKSFLRDVGFRGIGIYSAFHLCDRMVLRTKVSGAFEEHLAEFDFLGMRNTLNAARVGKQDATALIALLTDFVTFRDEPTSFEDSRTIVELYNIGDLHYGHLSTADEVERYLLDTVPIDFAADFPYRKDINARLQTYLPDEQRPITVTLAFKSEQERVLHKKMPSNLAPPLFQEVRDSNNKLQAFIWGCRNERPEKIDDDRAGFIYKLKGFTIGQYSDLRDSFRGRAMLYPWWTGEVYVLNDKVVPTTARDAFEYNTASHTLGTIVRDGLEPFRENAEIFQAVSRAETIVNRIESDFRRLEAVAAAGVLTPSEHYELIKCEKDVQAQAKRLRQYEALETKASEVRTRALNLHQQLKHLRKVVEKHAPQEDSAGESPKAHEPRSARASDLARPSHTEPLPSPPTIGNLFGGLDLDDAAEAREALEIVLACIDDVMDQSSETYRELFDAIEARLSEELDELA